MIRRPPRSTRTDTLFPYTTLFRSMDFELFPNGTSTQGVAGVSFVSGLVALDDESVVIAGSAENWSERSEEHTSELQSLMRISYAVFCLNKKKIQRSPTSQYHALVTLSLISK